MVESEWGLSCIASALWAHNRHANVVGGVRPGGGVPVILWMCGRYRLPREGYLLVQDDLHRRPAAPKHPGDAAWPDAALARLRKARPAADFYAVSA